MQYHFESADCCVKEIDWRKYSVYDAAYLLRQYINNLPEPVIPTWFYHKFCHPLRPYLQNFAESEIPAVDLPFEFDYPGAYEVFKTLIIQLPQESRVLLLYMLDLFFVLASESSTNGLNAVILSSIFQPGILSLPKSIMTSDEAVLSQATLAFLIETRIFSNPEFRVNPMPPPLPSSPPPPLRDNQRITDFSTCFEEYSK